MIINNDIIDEPPNHRTYWKKHHNRRIKKGSKPVGTNRNYYGTYDLFAPEQTEPCSK